jgi:excisionase family DNA binding protein
LKLEEMNMALTFVRKPATRARPVASPPPSLVSIRDAAEYYRVSQQTVRRMIKAGKIKVYRVGRQIRIDPDDLVDC